MTKKYDPDHVMDSSGVLQECAKKSLLQQVHRKYFRIFKKQVRYVCLLLISLHVRYYNSEIFNKFWCKKI
jgi:hypothetical protein